MAGAGMGMGLGASHRPADEAPDAALPEGSAAERP
jgi:hypothetical protein